MKLKTNYQYTYFIHPFVVKENKYQKYLLRLIRDKKIRLKTFQKGKDLELYSYFLPKSRDFLFSSFSHSKLKLDKLNELPEDTKSAILSKYPCTIFEYILDEDIQGKSQDKGIFFKVQKIEIICFNSGICFFSMKTNIENSDDFSDVLNFNYKFRDIKQSDKLKDFDKIYLQTDTFENTSKLTEFIKDLTGSDIETMKLDIDTQRFLTYSYVCVDKDAWNANSDFSKIEHNFIKYVNFLPADNVTDLKLDEADVFSAWKYTKIGTTKQGVTMFASSEDINNFIDMPDKYENQYFYTYILNLYKKIYLKKLEQEFKMAVNLKKARKKFIEFTKNLWIQDITEDEIGSSINYKLSKALDLERLYYEIKTKYDILYKEMNIEKNSKTIVIVAIVLVISLIFNILNYIEMLK